MCLLNGIKIVRRLPNLLCDALNYKKLSECHVRYAGIDRIHNYMFVLLLLLLLLLLFILPPSILKILADLLLCVCVHILQGHLSVQVPGCRVHIYMVQVKILLLYLFSFFRQVVTEDLHSPYQYDLLG